MNVEAAPSKEQQAVPENVPSVEVPSSQPAPSSTPAVDAPTPDPVTSISQSAVPNVVDLRTNHEELESVDEDAHKLTKEADEEEEDFIHHVEEVHTIK
jgi:hypothetical protein